MKQGKKFSVLHFPTATEQNPVFRPFRGGSECLRRVLGRRVYFLFYIGDNYLGRRLYLLLKHVHQPVFNLVFVLSKSCQLSILAPQQSLEEQRAQLGICCHRTSSILCQRQISNIPLLAPNLEYSIISAESRVLSTNRITVILAITCCKD